jgi:hypothetical protein
MVALSVLRHLNECLEVTVVVVVVHYSMCSVFAESGGGWFGRRA